MKKNYVSSDVVCYLCFHQILYRNAAYCLPYLVLLQLPSYFKLVETNLAIRNMFRKRFGGALHVYLVAWLTWSTS